jgi:hypothetical protein
MRDQVKIQEETEILQREKPPVAPTLATWGKGKPKSQPQGRQGNLGDNRLTVLAEE